MKLFVLYSLVAPCRGAGAEALEDLNEKNENDDREEHNEILVAVVAVVDRDLAEAPPPMMPLIAV